MPTATALADIASKTADYLWTNLSPRRAPVAYVGGWLGRGNLGDEALFEAARRLFPDFALWHFDGSRTLSTLLRALPLTSAGLFAGGTLINRAPEYLSIARDFMADRRRLGFFGVGVADPKFWTGRGDFRNMLEAWTPVLNGAGPIGVRGPRSAELLVDAGVREVLVVGDPALAFSLERRPDAPAVPHLGINIGHDHGHQWGTPDGVEAGAGALARMARSAGWDVTWFVVYPGDLAIVRAAAAASGTPENIVCTYRDPRAYLRAASRMSFFVGMKLHATLLALCAYVPSVMLEYEPKCGDFMASIGQSAAVVRTDRFAAAPVWDLLAAWRGEREARSRALFSAVQALRIRQTAAARRLAAALIA